MPGFDGTNPKFAKRFRLFTDEHFQITAGSSNSWSTRSSYVPTPSFDPASSRIVSRGQPSPTSLTHFDSRGGSCVIAIGLGARST